MSIINTKSLTKYYGKSRGIIDLDLSVNKGEYFGFIGPNGAGKSTTIRTLLGLISSTSGSATVFGEDVKTSRKEILSNVGYMPSEAMFYNQMKVSEVIAFSSKLFKKDCKKEADKLCEILSLDTTKRIEELSLGNRKKVSIVCAIQHNPSLYILDEPTSGLDPLMQKEFFTLLDEKNKNGATIFLSSHVLSDIQKNCTRAAIIKEGKIIADDSVENLSKTNAKRVTLFGVTSIPKALEARSIKTINDSVSFLYNGELKTLLYEAGKLNLYDMTIVEPDLEEVFMHYYETDGEA